MKRARKKQPARNQDVPDLQEGVLQAVERAPVRGCRHMGATADDGSCARCGLPAGDPGCGWEKGKR